MQALSSYLPKQRISSLASHELKFAKQQLHRLLSQQMSRVSTTMDKKNKLEHNLHQLHRRQQEQDEDKLVQLNRRLLATEEKRKKLAAEKMAQFRQNERKFQDRIRQRVKKELQQEREDAKRSKTYSDDLLSYFRRKELQRSHIQDQLKRLFEQKEKQSENEQKRGQEENAEQANHRKPVKTSPTRDNSIGISKRYDTGPSVTIDQNIKNHQRKAQLLQQEMWSQRFQRVAKKMDNIGRRNVTQPKTLLKRQGFLHNENRSREAPSEQSTRSLRRVSAPQHPEPAKKCADYLSVKRSREQEEFERRGHVYDKIRDKSRKDDIVRHLKSKIREYGTSLIAQVK